MVDDLPKVMGKFLILILHSIANIMGGHQTNVVMLIGVGDLSITDFAYERHLQISIKITSGDGES